jgi:glutathione S-transferase
MQKHSEEKAFRLITIPISHYCEKARWALERLEITYIEEPHPPLFHRLATSQSGGGTSVPVLVTEIGTFSDSTDILQYLDQITTVSQRLYPSEANQRHKVEKLENLFNTQLGPSTRLWFYSYLLANRELLLRLFCEGVKPVEQEIFTIVFGPIQQAMRQKLNITAESAASSLDKIKRIFATVNERLTDGRTYLVGNSFSAADLTFACLAAPTVLPTEYGVRVPQLEELPSEMAATIKELRETPSGKYVLRLFREERRPRHQLS